MDFINCIEQRDSWYAIFYEHTAKGCATTAQIDNIKEILTCYEGTDAVKYEHEMALKTEALQPAHQYVPWVVANGQHTDDIQNEIMDSLLNYVCNNYTGPNKSKACDSVEITY